MAGPCINASRLGLFDQLHHDAVECLRMGKRDPGAFGPGHRLFIDELQAGRLRQSQGRLNVFDLQTDVMQALASLFDGSIDRRPLLSGRHQLDMGTTHVEERHSSLLRRHFLCVLTFEPQFVLEIGLGGVEVSDGHRDVVELKFHARRIS